VYSRYGIGVTMEGTDRDQFLGKKKACIATKLFPFVCLSVNYPELKDGAFGFIGIMRNNGRMTIDRLRFPRLAEPAIPSGLQREQYAVVDAKNQEHTYIQYVK